MEKGEYGTLSTVGVDGQPYAVPLSYIVFHCAHSGQKLDNIKNEPRVCFCAVGNTEPIYDKNFTTFYESVIVYGTASKAEKEEKTDMLMLLAEKYLPNHMDKAPADIAKSLEHTAVCELLPT